MGGATKPQTLNRADHMFLWQCANYRPAGNFIGEERANVFPANGSAPPRDDPTPQRDNRMTEESPDEPLHPDLEGDLMRVMQSRGGGGGPGRGAYRVHCHRSCVDERD